MSYGLHESAEVGTELAQVNSLDLVPPHAMGAAQDFQKVDAGDRVNHQRYGLGRVRSERLLRSCAV